jgi:hypothetical protein
MRLCVIGGQSLHDSLPKAAAKMAEDSKSERRVKALRRCPVGPLKTTLTGRFGGD